MLANQFRLLLSTFAYVLASDKCGVEAKLTTVRYGLPYYQAEIIAQADSVREASSQLTGAGLPSRVMVDFSHANSRKQHERQKLVAADVAGQLLEADCPIMGVMVESHLVAGRQDAKPGKPLTYGQSITDACLGWDDSVEVIEQLAAAVRTGRLAAVTTG